MKTQICIKCGQEDYECYMRVSKVGSKAFNIPSEYVCEQCYLIGESMSEAASFNRNKKQWRKGTR